MKHILANNFNPENIEKYSDKYHSSVPFPYFVIDNFLNAESANSILDNFELNKNWINYNFINSKKTWGLSDKNCMNENCKEVFEELQSKEFVNLLSKITGIKDIFLDKSLDSGGLTQSFTGGKLSMHTDFIAHATQQRWRRVLNILIYFNKNWLEEYNGQLEFWDENLKQKVDSISPIFNRCLIFKTHKKSYHGYPETIKCPHDMSRKSLSAWYFVEEEKELEQYPTKYKPRPSDSIFYSFLIHSDTFLTKIFFFLKRYKIINNKFASKVLNLFK